MMKELHEREALLMNIYIHTTWQSHDALIRIPLVKHPDAQLFPPDEAQRVPDIFERMDDGDVKIIGK
jgi:hypothetical protein